MASLNDTETSKEETQNLKLLVLLSSPLLWYNGKPVDETLSLSQERDSITKRLSETKTPLKVRFAVATTDELQQRILDGYNVVHFSGHCGPKVLSFEGNYGREQPINGALFADLLRIGDECKVQLVVLNTCRSESLAAE